MTEEFNNAADILPLLRPGEKLLWHGRPARGIRFAPWDWLAIPFGFIVLWFAVIWISRAIKAVCPAVFGLLPLWVGYQVAIGRSISDARLRRHTRYVLTNRRALVVCRRPGRMENVLGSDLKDVCRFELRRHRDGSGSVAFSEKLGTSELSGNLVLWPSEHLGGAFRYIPNAAEVLRLMSEARNGGEEDIPEWTGEPHVAPLLSFGRLGRLLLLGAWLTGICLLMRARMHSTRGPITVFEMCMFGLFLLAGVFGLLAQLREPFASATYHVTPKRLIILRGRRRDHLVSIERDIIRQIEIKAHRDGTSTLTFNPTPPSNYKKTRNDIVDWPKFERIAAGEGVKELILPLVRP